MNWGALLGGAVGMFMCAVLFKDMSYAVGGNVLVVIGIAVIMGR